MNLKLKIEEDAELRAYIKKLFKSQIISVTRGEISNIFRDELNRKVKGMDTSSILKLMKTSMDDIARNFIRDEFRNVNIRVDIITPLIISKLTQVIGEKDWDKLVNDFATQRIQKLLKQ
jgi:hypothetical protein